jgi:glycosyltransferase involved in cell wall biosynthesis
VKNICLKPWSLCSTRHFLNNRSEKNVGAAANFNRVFELSSGEYFKWSAADNLVEPTFLERCVEVLDHNPEAILAYTKCKQINDFNHTVRIINTDRDLESPFAYERLRNLFLQVIGMQDVIWGLIRSSSLRKTHLIRSFVGADDCILIELILQGKFIEVPEHLLVLRIHPGGYHSIDRKGNWWEPKRLRVRDIGKLRLEGRKQAKWYDPDNNKSIYFPHWRRLREFFFIILRSNEKMGSKLRMMEFLCHLVSWRRIVLAAELWRGFTHFLHLGENRA